MSFFQKLTKLVQKSGGKSNHLLLSPSLKEALEHIDRIKKDLRNLRGKKEPANAFAKWGTVLADLEKRSGKEDQKPWRFVFDTPMVNGEYVGDPVIQICSGEPDFHRLVMTFTQNSVQTTFDTNCIDPNPDLSVITTNDVDASNANMSREERLFVTKISLATRKQQDEESGIQRIAILGAARVFIHGDQAKAEHQKLTKHVELQCNRFLDVFEDVRGDNTKEDEPNSPFRTVNGGWAGALEGSTGLPLISNLIGTIEDAKYKRESVTIMPRGGAYDHVAGVGLSNYFEVPGTWGDDSKYLIGFSSAAIIFEPYGFWTGIELRNAVAQGKPVVVVRGPDAAPQPMKVVEIDLPGNTKGTYREYSDLAQASVWIRRCCNIKFLDKFQQDYPDLDCNTHLDELKACYIDNKLHLKDVVKEALQVIPSQHQRAFKLAMVKQHGGLLKFLSAKDKKDKEIVIHAVKQNPEALQFVSSKTVDYKKIVSLAETKSTPHRVIAANQLLQTEEGQLQNALAVYKEKRILNKHEYFYFGLFSRLGAYSKTQKFAAVDALTACLNQKPDQKLSIEQVAILRQGHLGKIVADWEHKTGRTIDSYLNEDSSPALNSKFHA